MPLFPEYMTFGAGGDVGPALQHHELHLPQREPRHAGIIGGATINTTTFILIGRFVKWYVFFRPAPLLAITYQSPERITADRQIRIKLSSDASPASNTATRRIIAPPDASATERVAQATRQP